MTNYEYIQSATIEEFYEFIYNNPMYLEECVCPANPICNYCDSCKNAFVVWLNSDYTG